MAIGQWRYVRFNGRATRLTYWLWGVGQWVALFAIVILVSRIFGQNLDKNGFAKFEDISLLGQIVGVAAVFLVGWIGVCVEVQRWHDRGKSGWWYWLFFIPLIGAMWTFGECGFLRGTPGPNRFGPDPLAEK